MSRGHWKRPVITIVCCKYQSIILITSWGLLVPDLPRVWAYVVVPCDCYRWCAISTAQSNPSRFKKQIAGSAGKMAPCLCAPTNHAGSFRCRLHRSSEKSWGGRPLASSSPSSAKGPLHSAETSSSKPGENRSGKRIMVPFARSNRVSTSKSSESKFRTELNRTLVAASKKEESMPSVEELRISTSEEYVQWKQIQCMHHLYSSNTFLYIFSYLLHLFLFASH